ncbi:MAG: cupin domain-containing protein [Proteobacteria bacterium]|nr:cupin domain-containing protein [Pseudomonadota bacterium]
MTGTFNTSKFQFLQPEDGGAKHAKLSLRYAMSQLAQSQIRQIEECDPLQENTMIQLDSPLNSGVAVADLNALKEFSVDKRVRKAIFKTGQLISEMVCYEPGQSTVPHQHPRQDETFFVVDGCVNMNIGGVEYVLAAGSALSVRSGILHDVRNPGPERSVIVFVKANTAALDASSPQ